MARFDLAVVEQRRRQIVDLFDVEFEPNRDYHRQNHRARKLEPFRGLFCPLCIAEIGLSFLISFE